MPAQTPAALLLLLLAVREGGAPGAEEPLRPPARIGVIGAGIGGTAAAYFLRQKFGRDVLIDVFERGEVGGRLATLNVDGQDYEAGGDVIHPQNLHMKHFAKDLGLSTLQRQFSPLGIYNGDEFVFEESSYYLWNLIKLFWNYGLNPLRMYIWVQEILDKFMRIYHYQSHDYAFSTNEGLLHALGGASFMQLLNQTIEEAMQEAGFSQKFINETVTAIMRFNYGQGASVSGFVGVISLLGVDPGLWSVEGGNKLVCSGLLSASKAQLISGSVLSLEEKTRQKGRSGDPVKQYDVTYHSKSGLTTELYDIVLIATPLQPEIAHIAFHNFSPPIQEFSRHYHQTVTTLVHGHINATFFGYRDPSQFEPSSIFTMENPKLFINGIIIVFPVKKSARKPPLGPPVWRVFSHNSLTKEQLNLLFSSYDFIEEKNWLAYPKYNSQESVPPIILHDQMYYLNGIEWLASAMEMSAIAAKNAVLLAHHHWYKNLDRVDQEGLHDRLQAEL
ncbi:prenylcysteine oxidase 1-like [Tiliqua scincoides]|uniref:prenylcysteine oxidase 1-like n=1 Tax=Tiliqua scincoides TaxID=71010 RepID=UPI00346282B6